MSEARVTRSCASFAHERDARIVREWAAGDLDGLLLSLVFLQIFDQHPLFGFRVHITPQDEAPEHCVARQELVERILLRREEFQTGCICGVEVSFCDVPGCAHKLEHFGSGEAVGARPDTWDAPQRYRRQYIVLGLACRRR